MYIKNQNMLDMMDMWFDFMCFVFFFQAEDGIRDDLVTGVQTCALPISSAWLEGYLIGPFSYTGTRADDPNDVIPHDDRRELRGGRLLAAWLDHHDAREQNTMDTWVIESKGSKGKPDASPGHVVHYYLDTSDCLGSEWDWEVISRRLGYSYVADWGDMARDLLTLGIPTRPWDRVRRVPGQETFAFFNVRDFEPDEWKNEYPNAAFSRMTERDGAWMARILARFTPELVEELASMGRLTDPARTAYLAAVLQGRLDKILERYLPRLSPPTPSPVHPPDPPPHRHP